MEEITVNRRYEIHGLIGEGGMAVVYRGRDLLLGREVAIKTLRPQFAADPNFRARFEREAQAAAGFTHPHIIDIYDVGDEGGTPYIVMAFVRGQTLKEIISAEGPFHPDDVAALLEQVCAALDYAHERGYVHRDVKPQNILVDDRGVAQVVDFGIAKGLADSDLTDVGTGLGTVHYLSPEQASGLMATPASDIYAAGVIAFEMLTKHLPFEADSAVGVAMRHVHDAPPRPSGLGTGVPPAVDAIVLRALDKDPTKRFLSAGAFARALTHWRQYETEGANVATLPAARVVEPASPMTDPDGPRVEREARFPAPARRVEAGTAGRGPRPAPVVTGRTAPRDDIGCATWVVGIVILLGLIGLIWLGFRLSPRLANVGGGAVTPTELPAAVAPTIEGSDGIASGDAPEAPAARSVSAEADNAGQVPVPALIGMRVDEATTAANERGLLLARAEPVFSEQVPVDRVAEQEPQPNTMVAQGGTVEIKLSRGSGEVDLEALKLTGRDPTEAEGLLRHQGLEVTREEVASTDVAPGLVAGSDPPRCASAGQTVTLGISVGDKVRIPGALQGEPLDQAAAQLERLGLRVGQRFGVDQRTIVDSGLDPATAGIEDQDVVGVQGDGVGLDAWVAKGTVVDLVYYDRTRDAS